MNRYPVKSYWQYYLLLAILFAAVTAFNFTKPFGFFRESNPALVAINANYWAHHPETRKQNIPIASYAFDKSRQPSTQFDNTITTFGFAWFSVPYYFFQITGIPAGPIGLRIFSLVWLALTVIIIYKLARQLSKQVPGNNKIVFLTVALYVFSPVILWYQVNGYVHETAVLPFYYAGWYCFLRLLQEKKTKWLWLTAISLFAGVQFDWLPVFQATVMSVYLLFSRKEQMPKWMFLIPGLFILLGVGYIFYTYTSWSSVKDYTAFMKWKFGSRTVGQDAHSFLSFWPAKLNILLFYVISYGVILLWALAGLVRKKHHPLLWLMIITAAVHHIVFWGFSSEHDYAALKMAFPIVFVSAIFISGMKKKPAAISAIVILSFSIAQYFFLHNYSYREGMYADERFFIKAGKLVKAQPADRIVFINTENKYFPQVEFYGERPYRMAVSVADAREQMLRANDSAIAVFIDMTTCKPIQVIK